MEAILMDHAYIIPLSVFFITFVVGYITLKVSTRAKLDEHTKDIKEVNNKISHLDTIKQSAIVCNEFRKEMKEDIKTITGTLTSMNDAVGATQMTVARIEGRLNSHFTK